MLVPLLIFVASALGLLALLAYQLRGTLVRIAHEGIAMPRLRRDRARRDEYVPPPLPPRPGGRLRKIGATDYADTALAPVAPGPPPENTDIMAAALGHAVLLRRGFPSFAHAASRSFSGGVPQVPTAFEWPRAGVGGAPLHFILQLDCAAVHVPDLTGLLPESGALCLFLDLVRPGTQAAVVWSEGRGERREWQELTPPPDLPFAYPERDGIWPWAIAPEHGTPTLPRWPLDPLLLPLPTRAADADTDTVAPTWPDDATLAEALTAAGIEPVVPTGFTPRDSAGPDGALMAPFGAFPHDWIAIQICAARMVRAAERAAQLPAGLPRPESDVTGKAARLTRIDREARAWFGHALGQPAFAAVDEDTREAFLGWLASHAALAATELARAASDAVETTLHGAPDAARALPDAVVARLASRHALLVAGAPGPQVRMPARMFGPASAGAADEGDGPAPAVLLFELGSDAPAGFHFGEGVLRLWIDPADLAARRFDRVRMTAPSI